MLAGGCQGWVGVRSDDAINPELFGNLSELGDIVAALGEFQRGDEGEKGTLLRLEGWRRADEAGFFGENHVDFGAGAVHFNAADRVDEIGGQIALRDHGQECAFGICVGEHDAGADFSAVFKDDGAHSSIARIDLPDWAAGADFGSKGAGSLRHGVGDGAHAAHDMAVEALLLLLAAAE